MVGNVLVNCAYGKNNPEEATVAFIGIVLSIGTIDQEQAFPVGPRNNRL